MLRLQPSLYLSSCFTLLLPLPQKWLQGKLSVSREPHLTQSCADTALVLGKSFHLPGNSRQWWSNLEAVFPFTSGFIAALRNYASVQLALLCSWFVFFSGSLKISFCLFLCRFITIGLNTLFCTFHRIFFFSFLNRIVNFWENYQPWTVQTLFILWLNFRTWTRCIILASSSLNISSILSSFFCLCEIIYIMF